ncbi:MAG: long-chain fatty acid--CoA ligase [Alphaproteobacteria bacterium]|nr:long-chain fatty acid--CoA ligase [Alphaproteobacteria bacterium]
MAIEMMDAPQETGDRQEHPWLRSYPEDVDWHAEIPVMPLFALLDHGVATYPDGVALDFFGKEYKYRELGELVARATKGLQELGVRKGVHVGLFLPNCPYYPIFYYAILKTGATVVNFNPLYAELELLNQVEDAEVDLMVTLDLAALYDKMAQVMRESRLRRIIVCPMADILPFPKNRLFPIVKRDEIATIPEDGAHIPCDRVLANDGAFRPFEVDPAKDIALLQYTGGTTGVPKGAMLTHRAASANALQCRRWFAKGEPGSEVTVAVLPFFHVFAMTVILNLSVYSGARLILLPRFEIDQLLKTITRKRPSLFAGVPTLFTAINTHPELDKYDLSSLKFCISGGASLPADVRDRFESLTGCTLVEGYGLSECSPVAACNPIGGKGKDGSIGLPYPGTRIEIVSLEDRETVLSPGEKGEICISGPQVMAGYWKRPDATAETLRGGRLHTGDVGYMDEDGFTFVVDRLKEVIIAGGYKIYPRNVEEAIHMHPAVAEVAVVGIDDAYRGQTVKAFVSLVEGATMTHDELNAFLEDKISPIEMPKHLELRDSLPKSAIGKILKKELLSEAQETEGP